jgi:response regulator RpfG family c-di-GMP phosphodiesterase
MDRTLLYIDPDPATQLLVRTVLAPEGFLVCEARTALEGQQSAARTRPDLVLVDVDVVKAAEVVPVLRQSPGLEQVRLLASTACAGAEHLEKMLAWGFDRVLLKPIDIDTLARELDRTLPPVAAPSEAPAVAPPASASPADTGHGEDVPRALGRHETATVVATTTVEAAPAAPVDAEPPDLALEPVDVPPLWRLSLTPGLAALVGASASTEGVLALLDDETRALVIVATASSRRASNGAEGDAGAPLGTRVRVTGASWLDPVVERREAGVVSVDAVAPSPLVPAGSQALLVVPVASSERLYGVAILGKRRGSKSPPFSSGHVARSLAQASRLAAVVRALEELDRATGQKRRELERLRIDTARTVLAEVLAGGKPARRGGLGRERGHLDNGRSGARREDVILLGVTLAERLGVSSRRRDVLRQALEVHDIGQTWVEDVLVPRATLASLGREALPDACARQGAEILAALDWPPPVVELVRTHQAWWNGEGQPPGLSGARIPVEARIMAVVTAFARLTGGRTSADRTAAVDDGLAELVRQAGQRFDPDVVEALVELGRSSEPSDLTEVDGGRT